ncbi:MaoC family dehydratase [Salinisphaera aquimarina]|uniref:MaoC family dehydratase n=1 Tax=Salinisphaera aquimarina TaxID=2094031 RepID=A0ABV7ERK4_9GAMM
MAQQQIRLEYDSLPAVMPSYLRAATTLSGGLSTGQTIPDMVAELRGREVRAEPLAKYRKVCGFSHAHHLPVTYPHVLAFPMHMAVMTDKRFPLKLLGLIHVRNEITQHRSIGADETLDLEVAVGGHREVAKGVEFDLITRVRDHAGDLIWEETGTMLSRQKSSVSEADKKSAKKQSKTDALADAEHTNEWQVPADIGRRYAAAAGDYNPIHLSPWSAKLFGFPRAIATGMWTKARAAAALEPELTRDAYTLALAFKKPVFLPSRARFGYTLTEAGADFALTNTQGDILHLKGDVRYL